MKICGIKLTHDASVAVIEKDTLIFSVEAEKIANNPRYSQLSEYADVESILNSKGLSSTEIDQFVIDGWDEGQDSNAVYYELNREEGKEEGIRVATYGRLLCTDDVLKPYSNTYEGIQYRSYYHVTGHIFGAYCTSPFAQNQEDAFVLVWDGGIYPMLFYYRFKERTVENMLPLFAYNGDVYRSFAHRFEPFSRFEHNDLSIAGKVMAYIALGQCNETLLKDMYAIHKRLTPGLDPAFDLIDKIVQGGYQHQYAGKDMIATFHVFLQELLVQSLKEKVQNLPKTYKRNLAFSGGCALNIKWNQAIRSSGVFESVWVPPFPNDSGSAIGTACSEMILKTPYTYLHWNVYSGPKIIVDEVEPGWSCTTAKVEDLAVILHYLNKPILFLNGCAELGPRALGNRSIFAPATDLKMKEIINGLKKREDYRPIAPICIEEDAPMLFDPGTPDPYMLFDHRVREEWLPKIPAVCHIDGTARLQTINTRQNTVVYQLLRSYKQLSGLPLLCNTSANLNGSGFFPDIRSAMKWGKIEVIFSEGNLYFKDAMKDTLKNLIGVGMPQEAEQTFQS